MQGRTSKSMHPLLFVLAAVLTVSSGTPAAWAADGPLEPGAWSVELGLDIDDSSDPAGAFALKRNLGERSALRIGVGLGFNEFDLEGTDEDTSPVSSEDAAQKSSSENWALFLHYVMYGAISDRVATQFSLGPVVQVQSSSARQSNGAGTPGFQEGEFSFESTQYGLEVLLGVEWFFTSRFSLGGQAGLRALTGDAESLQIFRSGDGPTYQIERQELTGDANSVSTVGSRIVLTGYF